MIYDLVRGCILLFLSVILFYSYDYEEWNAGVGVLSMGLWEVNAETKSILPPVEVSSPENLENT
jgi:hypothetical protein